MVQLEAKAASSMSRMSREKSLAVSTSSILDAIADDVRASKEFSSGEDVASAIAAMNCVLYSDDYSWGFSGVPYSGLTQRERLNPDHTLLDKVLDNRSGLPAAMSLVYAAVGKRLGIDFNFIALPGHVLVQPDEWSVSPQWTDDDELDAGAFDEARFVDPWGKGRIVDVPWAKRTVKVLANLNHIDPQFLTPFHLWYSTSECSATL